MTENKFSSISFCWRLTADRFSGAFLHHEAIPVDFLLVFLLLFLCSDSISPLCFIVVFILFSCSLLSPWCAHSRKPYKLISVKSSHWWLYGTMLHDHKILLSDEASVHLLLCPVHFVTCLILSRRLVPSFKRAWQVYDYDRILIFAATINSWNLSLLYVNMSSSCSLLTVSFSSYAFLAVSVWKEIATIFSRLKAGKSY